MINVSLKISLLCLQLVCDRINTNKGELSRDPKDRAAQLILIEVYTKLINKYYVKFREPKKKPFKISLKYYHAYTLKEALLVTRDKSPEQVIVNAFLIQLDQKLN